MKTASNSSSCRMKISQSGFAITCGLLLLTFGALVFSLFSPWYVAEVQFSNCDRPNWGHRLSVDWFHNAHQSFRPSVQMNCSQNGTSSLEQVNVLMKKVFEATPSHFPRGKADQIYVITFVLQVASVISVSLASLMFLFRLVKPNCHSEGLKFLSIGACLIAFIFSLAAVSVFSIGLPISESSECVAQAPRHGRPQQACVRGDMATFFDYSTYKSVFRTLTVSDVVAENRVSEFSLVSSFHPGAGWIIASIAALGLFIATLLSFTFAPPNTKPKHDGNEEKLQLLSTTPV